MRADEHSINTGEFANPPSAPGKTRAGAEAPAEVTGMSEPASESSTQVKTRAGAGAPAEVTA